MSPPRQPLAGWPSTLTRQEKRRAFLAGKMLVDTMGNDPECRDAVLPELDFFLTRPRDRELFELAPLPSACPTEHQPGLRVVMPFRGPSFLDLVPRVTDVDRGLWLSTANIDVPDASLVDLVDIMDATVRGAADRKRFAGLSPSAREVSKPALHYALYWGTRDLPQTRHQAEDCATASLSALGLDGHQAILFGHGDPDHPHVHVVVNRVHPATGRAADNRRYRVLLRDWAQSYAHPPDIQPTSQPHPGRDSPDAA